jgi:cAMP-dependent protein kinase regulator
MNVMRRSALRYGEPVPGDFGSGGGSGGGGGGGDDTTTDGGGSGAGAGTGAGTGGGGGGGGAGKLIGVDANDLIANTSDPLHPAHYVDSSGPGELPHAARMMSDGFSAPRPAHAARMVTGSDSTRGGEFFAADGIAEEFEGESDTESSSGSLHSSDLADGSSDILSNASEFASEAEFGQRQQTAQGGDGQGPSDTASSTHASPRVLRASESMSLTLELNMPTGSDGNASSAAPMDNAAAAAAAAKAYETSAAARGEPEPRLAPVAPADDPTLEWFRGTRNYNQRRAAVSAEVAGARGAGSAAGGGKAGGVSLKVAKSVDARLRLNEVLKRLRKRSWLFASLGESQRREVIDAMAEVRMIRGQVVIRQGDDGDKFYVVEAGECEVSVQHADGSVSVMGSLGPNSTFGELALLYFSPRAATVTCLRSTVLWALDRQTFRRVIQLSALARRREHEAFLVNIPLLRSTTSYERASLADNLFSLSFEPGAYVCRQGEVGDKFYIISDGQALVTQSPSRHVTPVLVKTLAVGDYFGELALLSATSRRVANVVAGAAGLSVLYMDRGSFTRLVGPSEGILRRNMEAYRQYSQVIRDAALAEQPVHFVPLASAGSPAGSPALIEKRAVNADGVAIDPGAGGGSPGGNGGGGGGGSGASQGTDRAAAEITTYSPNLEFRGTGLGPDTVRAQGRGGGFFQYVFVFLNIFFLAFPHLTTSQHPHIHQHTPTNKKKKKTVSTGDTHAGVFALPADQLAARDDAGAAVQTRAARDRAGWYGAGARWGPGEPGAPRRCRQRCDGGRRVPDDLPDRHGDRARGDAPRRQRAEHTARGDLHGVARRRGRALFSRCALARAVRHGPDAAAPRARAARRRRGRRLLGSLPRGQGDRRVCAPRARVPRRGRHRQAGIAAGPPLLYRLGLCQHCPLLAAGRD